jgi:hypothetical protein
MVHISKARGLSNDFNHYGKNKEKITTKINKKYAVSTKQTTKILIN